MKAKLDEQLHALARQWEREAAALERSQPRIESEADRRVMEMRARIARCCAADLRKLVTTGQMPHGRD